MDCGAPEQQLHKQLPGKQNRAEAAASLPALTSLFSPRDLPRQLESPFPNALALRGGQEFQLPQETAQSAEHCQPGSSSPGRAEPHGTGPCLGLEQSPALSRAPCPCAGPGSDTCTPSCHLPTLRPFHPPRSGSLSSAAAASQTLLQPF